MLYQQDLLRLDDERCARARTYAFECAQGSIRTVLSSASYCKSYSNALVVHELAALTVYPLSVRYSVEYPTQWL
jgi:hypothetical protein